MGLFAFERQRRLEKERLEATKPGKSSSLEEFRQLKEKARLMGIELLKGAKKADIAALIKKAGEKDE